MRQVKSAHLGAFVGYAYPPLENLDFAHFSTYINFGAITCHFDSQRCIYSTHITKLSLNRYDVLYQMNSSYY